MGRGEGPVGNRRVSMGVAPLSMGNPRLSRRRGLLTEETKKNLSLASDPNEGGPWFGPQRTMIQTDRPDSKARLRCFMASLLACSKASPSLKSKSHALPG